MTRRNAALLQNGRTVSTLPDCPILSASASGPVAVTQPSLHRQPTPGIALRQGEGDGRRGDELGAHGPLAQYAERADHFSEACYDQSVSRLATDLVHGQHFDARWSDRIRSTRGDDCTATVLRSR